MDFLGCLLAFLLLIYVFNNSGKDDSDSEAQNSGMIVYTDYKTGVQYLSSPLGSITPRLNRDGSLVIKENK